MWIAVLWAGLRVAMWITHAVGKFRHGLLDRSLKKGHAREKGKNQISPWENAFQDTIFFRSHAAPGKISKNATSLCGCVTEPHRRALFAVPFPSSIFFHFVLRFGKFRAIPGEKGIQISTQQHLCKYIYIYIESDYVKQMLLNHMYVRNDFSAYAIAQLQFIWPKCLPGLVSRTPFCLADCLGKACSMGVNVGDEVALFFVPRREKNKQMLDRERTKKADAGWLHVSYCPTRMNKFSSSRRILKGDGTKGIAKQLSQT